MRLLAGEKTVFSELNSNELAKSSFLTGGFVTGKIGFHSPNIALKQRTDGCYYLVLGDVCFVTMFVVFCKHWLDFLII